MDEIGSLDFLFLKMWTHTHSRARALVRISSC